MIKEQMKQKTKIKKLPIISVRFQWGTGGRGERICSILPLLLDTSLPHFLYP